MLLFIDLISFRCFWIFTLLIRVRLLPALSSVSILSQRSEIEQILSSTLTDDDSALGSVSSLDVGASAAQMGVCSQVSWEYCFPACSCGVGCANILVLLFDVGVAWMSLLGVSNRVCLSGDAKVGYLSGGVGGV